MVSAKRQKSDNIKVIETEGDLFDAPDGAVLIHACNCLGSWGGGIANAFKKRYPAAYKIYRDHCSTLLEAHVQHNVIHSQTDLEYKTNLPLGTALIIPPQPEDYNSPRSGSHEVSRSNSNTDRDSLEEKEMRKKHWIVCLFTSHAYGRYISKPHTILENSVHAIRDMRTQLQTHYEEGKGVQWNGKIYSCRFNSGLFRVPWKWSKEVLKKELGGMKGIDEVVVVRPEGERLDEDVDVKE